MAIFFVRPDLSTNTRCAAAFFQGDVPPVVGELTNLLGAAGIASPPSIRGRLACLAVCPTFLPPNPNWSARAIVLPANLARNKCGVGMKDHGQGALVGVHLQSGLTFAISGEAPPTVIRSVSELLTAEAEAMRWPLHIEDLLIAALPNTPPHLLQVLQDAGVPDTQIKTVEPPKEEYNSAIIAICNL